VRISFSYFSRCSIRVYCRPSFNVVLMFSYITYEVLWESFLVSYLPSVCTSRMASLTSMNSFYCFLRILSSSSIIVLLAFSSCPHPSIATTRTIGEQLEAVHALCHHSKVVAQGCLVDPHNVLQHQFLWVALCHKFYSQP